jgi:hypothetical protein
VTRRHSLAALNDALFGFGDAARASVIEWIASCHLDPLVNELLRDGVMAPGVVARGYDPKAL